MPPPTSRCPCSLLSSLLLVAYKISALFRTHGEQRSALTPRLLRKCKQRLLYKTLFRCITRHVLSSMYHIMQINGVVVEVTFLFTLFIIILDIIKSNFVVRACSPRSLYLTSYRFNNIFLARQFLLQYNASCS
jgi:hypothetical protein